MHKSLSTIVLAGLLAACGDPGQQQGDAAKAPVAPVPVTIDDTPVEVLQIGGTVLTHRAAGSLADPEDGGWRDAQEYRLDLTVAPPVHPSINLRHDATAAPRPVFLRAARDGENLYLRMRWADDSENDITGRTEFADAAAVQFALDGGPATSFMMGAPNGPVNIWYWKASESKPQNLAAGGFGSTTHLDEGGLIANGVYRDQGEWVVVFSRPLQVEGDHQVGLAGGTATMAFALWEGENKQRDGMKHVTMGWVSLQTSGETTASIEANAEGSES